jgi:hypothetical protein
LLSGFATVLVSVPVYAGAWLQKKGECYLKVSYALFKPSTAFDQNGDTVDLNAGDQSSGNMVPTIKSLSSRTSRSSKAEDRTVDLGDLTTGIRTLVFTGPVVVSTTGCIKVPLYGQSQFTSPSLGTAKVDGDFRVLLGRSFWPVPGYSTAEFGY